MVFGIDIHRNNAQIHRFNILLTYLLSFGLCAYKKKRRLVIGLCFFVSKNTFKLFFVMFFQFFFLAVVPFRVVGFVHGVHFGQILFGVCGSSVA